MKPKPDSPPPKRRKKRRTSTRVTLDDVARYCNVSKATVSRVLNDRLNSFPVSDEMIARVKAAAEQLGYRPNRLARAIRSQCTHLVGLSFIQIDTPDIEPDLVEYDRQVMGNYINSIIGHPGFKDYDLVIHGRKEQSGRPLHENDFNQDLLDGMIYLSPSQDHSEFLDAGSKDFPIVLMGRTDNAVEKVPCVDIDNRKMAARAVEHLVEQGRRKILMLWPERLQHICCIRDRQLGYRDALARHGLETSGEFMRGVLCSKDSVASFLRDLRCLSEVDAVFCANDDLAILCIEPLKALGYRIPQDIAVVGFDNLPYSQRTSPPLTTVDCPTEKMAYASIDLLLRILKKQTPYEPGFHEVETGLVVRGSTVA